MDAGFGGFPAFEEAQAANGFAQKKKKKKSKKSDPFGFDAGGEIGAVASDDLDARPASSRRVSFSDEAMGRPIEEFAERLGGDLVGGSFPGGASGPGPEGYSSPSSAGQFAGGSSYLGSPSHASSGAANDFFEDSAFSGGSGGRGGAPVALGPPPSAIDQALSRAAESRSFADSLGEPVRSPVEYAANGTGAQSGLGLSGQWRVNEEFGGPRRVQRGFSFSLNDMPDSAIIAGESPYYVGAHPPTRDHLSQPLKWNPLDGIGRHWAETEREALEMPILGATTKSAPSSGLFPSSLMKPGSLEEELQAAEQRVKTLNTRLFELESGMAASTPATQGHLKITIPRPLDGGKLGVAVQDLAVATVADPRALQHGWRPGDRILQVNGIPVCYMQEFANELNKALAANQAAGRPLVFDIWRQPGAAGTKLPASAPLPAAAAQAVGVDVAGVPAPAAPATATHGPAAASRRTAKWRAVCGESADSDSERAGGHTAAAGAATPPSARPAAQAAGGAVPLAMPVSAGQPFPAPAPAAAPAAAALPPGSAPPLALPAPAAALAAATPAALAVAAPAPGAAGPPRTWQPGAREWLAPGELAAGRGPGGGGLASLNPSRVLAAPGALAPGVAGGNSAAWTTQFHAAELAPMMGLSGPPATAPVQGSTQPTSFTRDSALPTTVTTVPMPGHPQAHHAEAVAVSRRRRLVC